MLMPQACDSVCQARRFTLADIVRCGSCALVVNAKVGEVSGHRRSQCRNGRRYCGQEGIQPHALVPDELFSVIGHALKLEVLMNRPEVSALRKETYGPF
jgi:hypothetical protein